MTGPYHWRSGRRGRQNAHRAHGYALGKNGKPAAGASRGCVHRQDTCYHQHPAQIRRWQEEETHWNDYLGSEVSTTKLGQECYALRLFFLSQGA